MGRETILHVCRHTPGTDKEVDGLALKLFTSIAKLNIGKAEYGGPVCDLLRVSRDRHKKDGFRPYVRYSAKPEEKPVIEDPYGDPFSLVKVDDMIGALDDLFDEQGGFWQARAAMEYLKAARALAEEGGWKLVVVAEGD